MFWFINFLAAILLVRVAGESLASSVPESASERCEQRALGLQKFAPDWEFVCVPEIELQKRLPKRPGKPPQVLQNLREAGIYKWI